jgi:hypothetical protein
VHRLKQRRRSRHWWMTRLKRKEKRSYSDGTIKAIANRLLDPLGHDAQNRCTKPGRQLRTGTARPPSRTWTRRPARAMPLPRRRRRAPAAPPAAPPRTWPVLPLPRPARRPWTAPAGRAAPPRPAAPRSRRRRRSPRAAAAPPRRAGRTGWASTACAPSPLLVGSDTTGRATKLEIPKSQDTRRCE